MEEYKQVIAVRTDLGMGRGKMAVQAAHAAVTAAFIAYREKKRWFDAWWSSGQKKIAVRVRGLEELLRIYREAVDAGLPAALIRDAGLTQLPPGTATAVAIGPAPADRVDRITGGLKLL